MNFNADNIDISENLQNKGLSQRRSNVLKYFPPDVYSNSRLNEVQTNPPKSPSLRAVTHLPRVREAGGPDKGRFLTKDVREGETRETRRQVDKEDNTKEPKTCFQ